MSYMRPKISYWNSTMRTCVHSGLQWRPPRMLQEMLSWLTPGPVTDETRPVAYSASINGLPARAIHIELSGDKAWITARASPC